MSQDMLVEVKNLKEYFNINTGMFSNKPLKAVDDVSTQDHIRYHLLWFPLSQLLLRCHLRELP